MNSLIPLNKLNGISISKAFWAIVNSRVASFGTAEMKNDIHFSIGYNPELDELNLHVTKNKQVDGLPKPKIEICRIKRFDLEAMLPSLETMAWNTLLEPLPVQKIRRRTKHCYRGFAFYPFGETKDPTLSNFAYALQEIFSANSKVKNKRLKIPASVEPALESLFIKPDLLESISQKMRWLPHPQKTSASLGFVISNKFTGCVILSGGKWWAIRNEISFSDFLDVWAGDDLSKSLQFKTLRAYTRIQQLENYKQAKEFNTSSIRLYHIGPTVQ